MKEIYETPEIEVIRLAEGSAIATEDDVISTSIPDENEPPISGPNF